MLITIVTPSFNQANTLEQTLQSVIYQRRYAQIQYIVVDGNSSDGSISILERYRSQIDILIIEPDRSQAHALNKAFHLATGDVIGWVNSDDYLTPDSISHLVSHLNAHPNSAAWIGSTRVIESSRTYITTPWLHSSGQILNWFEDSHFYQPSCFFSAKFFKLAGSYVREDLKCVFDVELWMRLTRHGSFSCTGEILSCARVYPQAITQSLPVRREIEYVFINFLHYGYETARRRLFFKSELPSYLIQSPLIPSWALIRTGIRKLAQSLLKRVSNLFTIN